MSNMPLVTIVIGLVLTAYGVNSGVSATSGSVTAYIPAFFGAALAVLGLVAMKDNLRKHAMHLAALVGVLGVLGGLGMGLPKLPKLISGDFGDLAPEKIESAKNAARSQILLGIVCLVFVGLCVNSFIQARRARQAGSPQAAK